MRLTIKMLDAMLTALWEVEAEGCPQGMNEDSPEAVEAMRHNARARDWVNEQIDKRTAKRPAKQ